MRLSLLSTIVVLACALLPIASALYPVPPAWPDQHTHREMMYTPADGVWNNKQWYYDWTNKHLRVDMYYAAGPQLPPFNFSSYWLNDDLYMYVWDNITIFNDTVGPSCVHMNLGFGMMRPDWFTDGVQLNTTWLGRKSDAQDIGFHNTAWTRKCATCDTDPNGYFNYFTTTGDNGDKAGVPFRLEAPDRDTYRINEYYDFEATKFAADDELFQLPASPQCTNMMLEADVVVSMRTLSVHEQAAAMKAAKIELLKEQLRTMKLAFPELLMALA